MAKLTAGSFQEWLANCSVGAVLKYHDGLLMKDRLRDAVLDELASRIMKAVDKGDVLVYQERVVGVSPEGTKPVDQAEAACLYLVMKVERRDGDG